MSPHAPDAPQSRDELVDLASRALGGRVIAANDELFADRRHLIATGPAAWDPTTFGPDGKVYDGWETRRRRGPLGSLPGPDDNDDAIVRLGAPGTVRRVVVDTAHFTGNYPASASVEALRVDGYPSLDDLEAAPWTTLVARSPLRGDTENTFDVAGGSTWTHVRLRIYPDGGVARLRVLGEVRPDPRFLEGTVDLLAAQHGGRVVGCSDRFYSSPGNLLRPGVAPTIGEGWETARRRVAGNEWVTFALAAAGVPRVLEVDTTHYVGNPPGAASLRGVDARSASLDDLGAWVQLVPLTALLPDTVHRFRLRDAGTEVPTVTHVRLDIHPDGGVNRVRLPGEVDAGALQGLRDAWDA
ncbi:allantoicase [Aquipuribacter sp. MA13-6]|uniref:allantoicase n=1 Tax=unclassified Aquipuribacter TaxID=2635084 RepID=UPI003EF04EF3